MTWIAKTPHIADHTCEFPHVGYEDVGTGSLWRCDVCCKVWRVSRLNETWSWESYGTNFIKKKLKFW
jgi:hypothetical protein